MSEVTKTVAISLQGLSGEVVTVETAVSNQLPGMAIIGLPDAAVAEAKHRVKVAISQSGLKISDKFVTVNLSPADVPKHGSGFDLAIALGILGASQQIPTAMLTGRAYLAELGLTGQLRRPSGLLSMVIAARAAGFDEVLVPSVAAAEAGLVPGVRVLAADTLAEAVSLLSGRQECRFYVSEPGGTSIEQTADNPDMSDIRGQETAVRALTIAAAGGHHMSMIGPPGAGKTMLASRLPTILPELDDDAALLVSSISSYNDKQTGSLQRKPPFSAPHHSASMVSIIGGGQNGRIYLGAVTKATHGVLFLDEAPEFARATLDALRQPLETGKVEIARAGMHLTLPANFQLVLAANPCPCGNSGAQETHNQCRCSPAQRVRYLQKISGPLKDRIDIRMRVHRMKHIHADEPADSSAIIAERVALARARARERFATYSWRINSEIPGKWLHGTGELLPRETTVLDSALNRGLLTMRGYDRILRLAWTIADLHGDEKPGREHIAEALSLREVDNYA